MLIFGIVYAVFFIGVFTALPVADKTIYCAIARVFVALVWPIYIINKITVRLISG